MWFACFSKKSNIPFYLISVFVVFSSVVNHLFALKYAIRKRILNDKELRLLYLIYYFFINILVISLGVRMGWAISFSALGLSFLFFTDGRYKILISLILILISALIHFSLFLIFFVLLLSKFVKVKPLYLPLVLFLSFILGKTIIPFILGKVGLGGISEYAINGYIENQSFSNAGSNLNQIIVTSFNYFIMVCIISLIVLNKENKKTKFTNFVMVYISVSFLMASFFVVFNRYFVEVGIYFYLLLYFSFDFKMYGKLKYTLLMMAVVNLFFTNIYLQRRPIVLGDMWMSLIVPPIVLINRNESDFNKQLINIDKDGNWIGHEVSN